MKLPIKVPRDFRIIAHRGASGYAPENTLAAFRLAEKMGVKEVELDVWLSKDNHIVLCHDGALDRYGYPGLHVKDLQLDEQRTPILQSNTLLTLRCQGLAEPPILGRDFFVQFLLELRQTLA